MNPMRYIFTPTFFLVICFAVFSTISFGQVGIPMAHDDFYVVDVSQNINTYENDVDYANGFLWHRVTNPSHGSVGPGCSPGLGCCQYCVFFVPNGNYTGADSYVYNYIPTSNFPPGTPDSNNATVNLLLIGNDDAQNAGACQIPHPSPNVGKPVNVTNGNMWLEQTDFALPGPGEPIEINRFYNSMIQSSGLFGYGWSTKYDASLQIYPDDKMIRLNEPDGRASYFGRADTASPFTSYSPSVIGQTIKNADNSYTFTYKDGRVHQFNAGGRLIWQKDRIGNQTTLNYSESGLLTGITDPLGELYRLL